MRYRYLKVTMVFLLLLLTGCSEQSVNRQIAESIGTLGQYENDEPVQTPKMEAQEEMRQRQEAMETKMEEHLRKAEEMALHYEYQEAIEELDLIDEEYQQDERVTSARSSWQRLLKTMYTYDTSIAHFCVDRLVVDPKRVYTDDDNGTYYNNWTLTTDEFERILEELYRNNYILMDITETAMWTEDEEGEAVLEWTPPLVPDGKVPIVISFLDTEYGDNKEPDGFAGRMVLDAEGNILNEYTDAGGNTKTGTYDAVSVLDAFVDEHPDFSLRGARGIVAVSGVNGVFGYDIETQGMEITEIADKLREKGWQFACLGYQGISMESAMTGDEFIADMKQWSEEVAPLTGESSLLFFPNGDPLTTYGYKHMWAMEHGYWFYFSQWATSNYMLIHDDYAEQSRRTLDGYDLYYYGDSMTEYFDTEKIWNQHRLKFE